MAGVVAMTPNIGQVRASIIEQLGRRKKGGPSPEKAKEMLAHGEVHGQALTDRQKRYFHALAAKKR